MQTDPEQPAPPGRKRLAICWRDSGAKISIKIHIGHAVPHQGARILRIRPLGASGASLSGGASFRYTHHPVHTLFHTFHSL